MMVVVLVKKFLVMLGKPLFEKCSVYLDIAKLVFYPYPPCQSSTQGHFFAKCEAFIKVPQTVRASAYTEIALLNLSVFGFCVPEHSREICCPPPQTDNARIQTTEALYKRGLPNSRSIQSQVFICTSIYAPSLLPQVHMQCWPSFLDTQVLHAPLPVWGFGIFVYTSNRTVVLTLLSLLSFPHLFHCFHCCCLLHCLHYLHYLHFLHCLHYFSAVLGCTGLYWAILGCTGPCWAALDFIGPCWTVLVYTGLYWAKSLIVLWLLNFEFFNADFWSKMTTRPKECIVIMQIS